MKKSSFIEGSVISTISIIIVKMLGMLYVIPFYAMVGVKGSALYAYAYNIYVIFLDISTAGLPIAVSKIIGEYEALDMPVAKERTYYLGKMILSVASIAVFTILVLFAPQIAKLLLGDLSGGNTIKDVSLAIRCISPAILVIPFLSVSKGYLQGHQIYGVSSVSQIIEQVIRIAFMLVGTYLLINVFHQSITTTICLAVNGAFIGGLFAYLYVLIKIKKNKKTLFTEKKKETKKIADKEIIKKIVVYAVPFIIINTAYSIYNFTDMVLISRTMNFLKLPASDVEFITSSITTWSSKICMIVTSVAMGMTVSLIPAIVNSYALKDFKEVNNKVNDALKMLLMLSLPMTIGLSLLCRPVWFVFYGTSTGYGPMILAIVLYVALFGNIYMIVSSSLQALNRFKLVYKSCFLGFILNALLDVPIMLFYDKVGIPACLGASTASLIGYAVSFIYALSNLKRELGLNYKPTFKLLKDLTLPLLLMISMVVGLMLVIPVNYASKLSCIIYIAICAICGGLVYFVMLYKDGILKDVLGKELYTKVMKIVTFGKYKVK